MQLYFIRHGQSQNNANWQDPAYSESPDPGLTEVGFQQARILAQTLPKYFESVDKQERANRVTLYTSLMERAVHTAAPLARTLDLPLLAWPEIHESGGIFGRQGEQKLVGLPGKPRSYFIQHIPELTLPDDLDESGWWNRPFETEEECQVRAEWVWTEILSRHGDGDNQSEQCVVFVSHGGFFVHLVCAILDIPWRQASNGYKAWFLLNNCSVTRIIVRKDEIVIAYMNRTEHLPKHMIT